MRQLQALELQRGEPLWIEHTPLSLTIRFKQVHPDLIFKYSLSSETLFVNGQKRAYNHIFIMPHVTSNLIDQLIADLRQTDAFPTQPIVLESTQPPVTSTRDLMHFPHTGRGFRGS